ncbi:MAG: hypothetical protein AABY44_02790 [Nitrospirota bacterium]
MMKNQWRKPEELAEIQNKKLRKLIRHAYDNVPFYRNMFMSHGLKPDDIRTTSDLQKIPIMTKSIFKSTSIDELTAQNIGKEKLKILRTSGSTGIPLEFLFHDYAHAIYKLSFARAYFSNGVGLRDRIAQIVSLHRLPEKRPWYEYLGLWRRRYLKSFEDPREIIEKLKMWKPDVLIGTAMTLKMLALTMRDEKVILGFQLKAIFSSSELLDRVSRALIAEVFRTKVIDIYGSVEGGGCIAYECGECGGYHINTDTVVLELVADGKRVSPGQRGEVLITNLHSYAMPIIRYNLEDIAILSNGPSRCGRGFPLLKDIEGRRNEFITLPSMRKLPPEAVIIAFHPVKGIFQWRLIQLDLDRIKVEFIRSSDFDSYTLKHAEHRIKKLTGKDMEILFENVDHIDWGATGKRKLIHSLVER